MSLQIEIIKKGNDINRPVPGNKVTVHYIGMFENGKKFDSSRDREQPFTFTLGQGEVIKGWDEGLAQMSIGQRIILTCPPQYAYGAGGIGGIVPPDSTLKFDIELISFK